MAYFLLNANDNTVRRVSDNPFSTRYNKFKHWKIIEVPSLKRSQYLKNHEIRVEMDNKLLNPKSGEEVWKYFDKESGNWYEVKEIPKNQVKYDEGKKIFVDVIPENPVNKETIKIAPVD